MIINALNLRSWRNWYTRYFEVVVGNRGSSSLPDRTRRFHPPSRRKYSANGGGVVLSGKRAYGIRDICL